MGVTRPFHYAVLVALALAGCAPSVSEYALDGRTMMLSGSGGAFNSMGGVQQSLVRHAAVAAQERGFEYFVLSDPRDQSSTGYWQSPTQTQSTATGSAFCSGSFCSGQATGTSTTYGGQLYQFNRPGMSIMVRFFRPEEIDQLQPKDRQNLWSAASVLAAQE